MKRASILAVALLAAACSPQVYPLYLDVRQPSSSGLTLAGKNISIVYKDGANDRDSLFDRTVASTLARQLEADYFGGNEVIGLYGTSYADSVSLDLMHALVMDTDGDVVFLLSSRLGEASFETNQPVQGATSVDSAFVCTANVPVNSQLQVYDSMGEDKILNFKGNAVLRGPMYNNGMLSEDGLKSQVSLSMAPVAEEVGERISRPFLSRWKTETFSFYYFDGGDTWIDPLQCAADGEMSKAIDGWMALTRRGDALKRACASYNIAQTFYLLEDLEMASRWLEYAKKLENLSLADGLEKRISARLEKK